MTTTRASLQWKNLLSRTIRRRVALSGRLGRFSLTVTYPDETTWVLSDRIQRKHYVRFIWKQSDGEWIRVVSEVELAAFDGGSATYSAAARIFSLYSRTTRVRRRRGRLHPPSS